MMESPWYSGAALGSSPAKGFREGKTGRHG